MKLISQIGKLKNFKNVRRRILFRGRCVQSALQGGILHLFGHKTIKMFWYCYDINFGDTIGPALIRRAGYFPVYSRYHSVLVSTGSILDALPESFSGFILGAGFINENATKRFPNAEVYAVRGKLTAEKLHCRSDVVLGDPGLIACDLVPKGTQKDHPIGIVAHYSDKKHPAFLRLYKNFSKQFFFIDVQRNIESVLNDINRCECILSSSLHGCIVSDGLKIPNAWIQFKELIGGHFKFHDYYSALDVQRHPVVLNGNESVDSLRALPCLPPEKVGEVQDGLRQLYGNLPEIINRRTVDERS